MNALLTPGALCIHYLCMLELGLDKTPALSTSACVWLKLAGEGAKLEGALSLSTSACCG